MFEYRIKEKKTERHSIKFLNNKHKRIINNN